MSKRLKSKYEVTLCIFAAIFVIITINSVRHIFSQHSSSFNDSKNHHSSNRKLLSISASNTSSSIVPPTYANAHKLASLFNCSPLAISNFPADVFTQRERLRGAVLLHVLIIVYVFIGIALVSDDYFVPSLERICEILRITPDVAGATFMAAGSSAPELATTMIGVFIAKDDIGLGAVIGSADFNIMFVIGVSALFVPRPIRLNWWPLTRDCFFYSISIIFLAVVIYDEKIFWYESALFLLAYAIYIVVMARNKQLESLAHRILKRVRQNALLRTPHSSSSSPQTSGSSSDKNNNEKEFGASNGCVVSKAAEFELKQTLLSRDSSDNDYGVDGDGEDDDEEAGIRQGIKRSEQDERDNNSACGSAGSTTAFQNAERYDVFRLVRLESADTAGCFAKCFHFVALPMKLLHAITIPDSVQDRAKNCWSLSFVLSCLWISVYSYVMIWMISIVGYTFSISDSIMGLTFIAIGASVPDAIASVIVVKQNQGDMAVSNAVGSNIFDILLCMGLPWLLKNIIYQDTVYVYSQGLVYATFTLLSAVLVLFLITHYNAWRLTKLYGVVLIVIYFIYLAICIVYELNILISVRLPACPL